MSGRDSVISEIDLSILICGGDTFGISTPIATPLLLRCTITNEVNFWFAWHCWSRSWYRNFWRIVWFFYKDINESFLFILRRKWNLRRALSWWSWRLNKNYFVMLLCRWLCNVRSKKKMKNNMKSKSMRKVTPKIECNYWTNMNNNSIKRVWS